VDQIRKLEGNALKYYKNTLIDEDFKVCVKEREGEKERESGTHIELWKCK
jgi:hypothetical protein